MRLYSAPLVSTTAIRPGVQLLEVHVPNLAQTAQPGQFCMIRCSSADASDPLLRRPFYVHGINRSRGTCTFYIAVGGRGTTWLAAQPEGAVLDILGPLGHGWTLRPTTRNALLIGEERSISSLTLLAQVALENDIAVTLINGSQTPEESYPPALLHPEVEYIIVTEQAEPTKQQEQKPNGRPQGASLPYTDSQFQNKLLEAVKGVLSWSDAAYCSVSHETSLALYSNLERMRGKNFAQGTITRALVCGTGMCFTCSVETRVGQKLVCRDGPVFDLRDIVR